MVDDLAQRQALGGVAHRIDQRSEGQQVGTALARHRPHALVQAAPTGAPRVLQQFERARADAARGEVDHAQEAGVVVRVLDQPQVGQRMLDLGALEEAQAAVDAVRDAGIEQRAFQHPALCVAAVQQRDLAARHAAAVQRLQFFQQPLRLGEVAGRLEHAHRLAGAGLGTQVLAQALRVVRDQRVRRIEDVAEAAVVLFQLDDLLDAELALEIGHVADLGATEGVDALVVVADREHALRLPMVDAARRSEHLEPRILQPVGVLELVDQHMAEAPLVMLAQRVVVTQQFVGAQHQLGEVDHAFTLALVFVGLVDLDQLARVLVADLHIARPAPIIL